MNFQGWREGKSINTEVAKIIRKLTEKKSKSTDVYIFYIQKEQEKTMLQVA